MSWSGKTKARKFAAPGEIAALFGSCTGQSSDSGTGQAVLRDLKNLVDVALARTPHDCDITVETDGHVAPDGLSGGFTLTVGFGPHVAPQVTAPVISDAVPPSPQPAADPSVVGNIPPAVPEPPAEPVATSDVASEPAAPSPDPVSPTAAPSPDPIPPAEGSLADAVGLTAPEIPTPPAP